MRFNLVLDVGNSRTKLGLFLPEAAREGGAPVRTSAVPNGDIAAVKVFVEGSAIHRTVVGSVARENGAFVAALEAIAPVLVVSGSTAAPVMNGYASPATLGADRLANAVGARLLFPERPVLAIDLGTCVTYDLVDRDGTFRGGIISPGLHMRARAMHAFSARLPQVDPPEAPTLVGVDTMSSLVSGVHHGLRAELRTLIAEFRQQHQGLGVVLTGGDSLRMVRALENGIFAHSFLTLSGLHAILEHNHPTGGAAALR